MGGGRVSIPFRVLVGFLQEAHIEMALERYKLCFNPFQGFGGVSAGAGDASRTRTFVFVSIPFRVLVGFLQASGGCAGVGGSRDVSIPFRVLVGFLPVNFGDLSCTHVEVSIPFRVLVGFLRVVLCSTA